MLDKLLEYHELPGSDEFVSTVMRGVAREQRLRKLILLFSGLLGTTFGLLGVYWLAEPLAPLISQFLAADKAAVSGLLLLAVLGCVAWLLHDEPGMTV